MRKDGAFFAALALVTALPFIALPICAAAGAQSSPGAVMVLSMINSMLGSGHIGATAVFYADPSYQPVMARRRGRLYWAAIGVPIVALALSFAGPEVMAVLFVGFLAWQAYHYQRQNYGLTALAAVREGVGPLPRRLNRALNLASLAGAIALIGLPGLFPYYLRSLAHFGPTTLDFLRVAALAVYALASIDFVLTLRAWPRAAEGKMTLGFAVMSWAFFLPALLSGNILIAFWTYALAHAGQYFVMAGICSKRSPLGWTGLAMCGAGAGVFFWAGLWMQTNPVFWPVFFALTVVHFIVDAQVWRLREPTQRGIIQQRFDFIFPVAARRGGLA